MEERIVGKEYREYAAECLEWAKTAKSDREREIFLQMANTWLQAASCAERRTAPHESLNGAPLMGRTGGLSATMPLASRPQEAPRGGDPATRLR